MGFLRSRNSFLSSRYFGENFFAALNLSLGYWDRFALGTEMFQLTYDVCWLKASNEASSVRTNYIAPKTVANTDFRGYCSTGHLARNAHESSSYRCRARLLGAAVWKPTFRRQYFLRCLKKCIISANNTVGLMFFATQCFIHQWASVGLH